MGYISCRLFDLPAALQQEQVASDLQIQSGHVHYMYYSTQMYGLKEGVLISP